MAATLTITVSEDGLQVSTDGIASLFDAIGMLEMAKDVLIAESGQPQETAETVETETTEP